MRRRESTFELLIALPWYIAAAIGAGLYLGAPSIASFIGTFAPILAQLAPTIAELAKLLSYIVLGAGALSLIRGFLVRRKFAEQRTLADLRALSWQMFESIVGEAFHRQGYTVIETGLGGADGGVDLVLSKDGKRYFVQCKQYRASSVSVTVVREIFGVVAAQRAAGAIVVTTGTFTKDAIAFAAKQPIELVDGAKLEMMVRDINGIAAPVPVNAEASASAQPSRPAAARPADGSKKQINCPKCDSTMVLRTAREKGTEFYGCSRYPRCRGTRQV
jgi:restriction system protein